MKNLILSVLLIFSAISGVKAQIGINTSTPDSSSAMDIQSPPGGSDNRGVLFPRMTTAQRLTIANPAASLFVFDTSDSLFYYFDGSNWLGLVPKVPGNGGSTNIKGNIILDSGRVVAPTGITTSNLSVAGFPQNALVPAGTIVMWSGDPALIPTGWALCNGLAYNPNGTVYSGFLITSPSGYPYPASLSATLSPDLRGRFVVGYNPAVVDYNFVGKNGGLEDVTLTSAQSGSPAHTHTATLTGATTTSGVHTHTVRKGNGSSGNGFDIGEHDNTGWYGPADGGHSHNVSVSGTTGSSSTQNASAAHENRPPYYVLAYIIKLK